VMGRLPKWLSSSTTRASVHTGEQSPKGRPAKRTAAAGSFEPVICEQLEQRTLLAGVTIVTHGFSLGAADPSFPVWVDQMRDDIADRIAQDLNDIHGLPSQTVQTGTIQVTDNDLTGELFFNSSLPSQTSLHNNGEVVLSLDWSDASGPVFPHSTEQVGRFIAEQLFGPATSWLLELPIHLIGHSRGGSLIGAMADYLGRAGVWVDQLTFLDTHPVGTNYDDYRDGDTVNTPYTVVFADTYYRQDGNDEWFDFDGHPAGGSYAVQLYENPLDEDADTPLNGYDAEHRDIHLWYRGTISPDDSEIREGDTSGTEGDDWARLTDSMRASWYYQGGMQAGQRTGFYYSRTAEGWAQRPLSGIHNDMLFNGASGQGARDGVPLGAQVWPNLLNIELLGSPSIQLGDSLFVGYSYFDADSSVSIEWHLDTDMNPFNGRGTFESVKSRGSTGSQLAGTTDSLPIDVVAPGSYYLLATISDGLRDRYMYAPTRITVGDGSSAPYIEALIASPVTVPEGDPVFLEATGVTDDEGVVEVFFYRDANGTGVLEPQFDEYLWSDASATGGWTWTGGETWPTGQHQVFAVAQDADFNVSNIVTTFVQVDQAVPGGLFEVPDSADYHHFYPDPGTLATGDFVGDGAADVVVMNIARTRLTIYDMRPGETNEAFYSNRWREYEVGGSIWGRDDVIAADLNGDELLDIAYTSQGASEFRVLFNLGPDGLGFVDFSEPVSFETPLWPSGLRAGDLDRDGDLDLVVAYGYCPCNNDESGVVIFRNHGAGGFSLWQSFQFPQDWWAPSARPIEVILADLDLDNSLDIVVSHQLRQPSYLLNEGDGIFAPPITFGDQHLGGGELGNCSLAVVDMNGDALPEIISGYGSTVIYTNFGNGSFSSAVRYPRDSSSNSMQITVGDYDGDGDLDLAYFTSSDIGSWFLTVQMNNGDGTLGGSTSMATVGLFDLISADVDADGDLDLIYSGRQYPQQIVGIFRNESYHFPTFALMGISPSPLVIGRAFDVDAAFESEPGLLGGEPEVRFYLDDGDGEWGGDATEILLGVEDDGSFQGGSFTVFWTGTPMDWWGRGSHVFYVQARLVPGGVSVPIDYPIYLEGPPLIDSLSGAPNPMSNGETLTLEAFNVMDPLGSVARVEFYRDDGNGVWDGPDSEVLLDAPDTSADGGWTWSGVVDCSWQLGTTRVYARAIDDAGLWSEVVETEVILVDDHADPGHWADATWIQTNAGTGDGRENGRIELATDRDLFEFVARGSGTAVITVNTLHGGLDPHVVVYDGIAPHRKIASNNNGGDGLNARVSLEVEEGRSYYLLVKPVNSTAGCYLVEIDDDHADAGEWADATSIEIDEGTGDSTRVVRAELWTGLDRDLFQFVAAGSGTAKIDLIVQPGGSWDPFLALFGDADGDGVREASPLATDDNGAGDLSARIRYDLVEGRTYWLLVKNLGPSFTFGDYRLSIDDDRADVGQWTRVQQIDADRSYAGEVWTYRDKDVFKFTPGVNDLASVVVTPGSPPTLTPWLVLLVDGDGDGVPDDRNGDGVVDTHDKVAAGPGSIQYPVKANTTYFAVVKGTQGTTGPYTLELSFASVLRTSGEYAAADWAAPAPEPMGPLSDLEDTSDGVGTETGPRISSLQYRPPSSRLSGEISVRLGSSVFIKNADNKTGFPGMSAEPANDTEPMEPDDFSGLNFYLGNLAWSGLSGHKALFE